ncbi:hypothetical protein [Streptomyces cadmiisoli]|uniref:hypothetical protein n=1 Tax=Streptomyces cadmiisoli TaxID=2184053 RepID=UPI00364FC852
MSADHCPDHWDRLDLCPQCQGLTITRMTRLHGVSDFRMWDGDGRLMSSGRPAAVYLSRVEPCPNTPAIGEGAVKDV